MEYDDRELKEFYRGEYVSRLQKQPPERISRLLPKFKLSSSDVVADFGCGDGLLMSLIRDKVARYTGVDFSEEFIASANRRRGELDARNVEFVCGDISEFCRTHLNEFDKAFTLDFSEHVYDPEFVRIYSSIRDSLKLNGTLYLHTPNADFLLEILKHRGFLHQFPEHVAVRNSASYCKLLAKAGFHSIEVHPISHYLQALIPLHVFRFLPLIGRYFEARLFISCTK